MLSIAITSHEWLKSSTNSFGISMDASTKTEKFETLANFLPQILKVSKHPLVGTRTTPFLPRPQAFFGAGVSIML